jgi:iron-sulfur cluster repair protein YtfE (RIC family)
MTKAHHQLHRVWIKQCEATEGIRLHHGAESALTRPEFARELPNFVSEIRRMFTREEMEALWPRIERQMVEQMESDLYQMEEELSGAVEGEDLDLIKQDAVRIRKQWEEKLKAARHLRDLLTSPSLGTA